ncbi:MAG: sugar phosphate isomerase/epimerase [Anaerolineales bacterium]|nr:sugar phosphate isomerase/epimerase [Anaerolineales bacterium]
MNIPVILSTGSLYHFDIDTVMALAAGAGFAGLELLVDGRRETYHPAHLEKLMARHHLPILAVHSPFATFPPPWPHDPVSRIKQSVHLAEALGAQTVVVHPPIRWVRVQGLVLAPQRTWKLSLPLPWAGPGRLGRWLQQELPAFQAQTRVKIAVENMPRRQVGPWQWEPYHFNNAPQLNRFPYLTLDTTHVGTWRKDLLHFYRQVKPRVAHVHLSNYNGREHQLLHCGLLPLAALLAELVQDNFDGLVSLELGPISLQADDETKLKQNLHASLAFCQQALISSKLNK